MVKSKGSRIMLWFSWQTWMLASCRWWNYWIGTKVHSQGMRISWSSQTSSQIYMPVCPIKSENYCIAWLLSQQDNFKNQPSMLETFKLIQGAGHEYIFLPKFQCELNPIKIVYKLLCRRSTSNNNLFSDPLCMHNRYGPAQAATQ